MKKAAFELSFFYINIIKIIHCFFKLKTYLCKFKTSNFNQINFLLT